jgi:hypothetical protein
MSTPGRPTSYKPEYCELARNYCLLGATNEELAAFFDVTRRTVDNWIATLPEFAAAVREARGFADARVARGLFDRAVGYNHEATRTVFHQGEERTVRHTVHYPPDVRACIFWLRNRQRRRWSDRSEPAPEESVDMVALLDAAGEQALREAS